MAYIPPEGSGKFIHPKLARGVRDFPDPEGGA